MNELELQVNLSQKTNAELIEIIIRLANLLKSYLPSMQNEILGELDTKM